MSRRGAYKKHRIIGQGIPALAFLLIVCTVFFALLFFTNYRTPARLYDLLSLVRLEAIDCGDNAVSEYSPVRDTLSSYGQYMLTFMPDIPSGYDAAIDWLRMLNRDYGVTVLLLPVPMEWEEDINGAMYGRPSDEYILSASGSYYGSEYFLDFLTALGELNSVLLPENKIAIRGIFADGSRYAGASADVHTLLLCDRQDALYGVFDAEWTSKRGILRTDILYASCTRAAADTAGGSTGAVYSDISLPSSAGGYYLVRTGGLEWISGWHDYCIALCRVKPAFCAAQHSGSFFILDAGDGILPEASETEEAG